MNIIEQEIKASFDFFYHMANKEVGSPGFGLISDNTATPEMASIASVGFGLSAYVIGANNGYISYEEAKHLVQSTLETFWLRVPHFHGFFPHFLHRTTAEIYKKTEYSTIDTAIFLNGALTADAYFNDEQIHLLTMKIFNRVDWKSFTFYYKDKLTFRMAYNPHEGGDYRQQTTESWIFQWHMFAEQLSMYVLAGGSDTISQQEAKDLYNGFERKVGTYKNFTYVYSPTNPLFVYQYSHAWIDFEKYVDEFGFDWYHNSKIATYANRQWCIDNQALYPTLSSMMWGITACLTPKGYRNQGVLPSDLEGGIGRCENVFAPCGPAGSAPFAVELVFPALHHLYVTHPSSFKEYGFVDGIMKKEDGSFWYSEGYIGINKGITLLMLDNALRKTTWNYYHEHPVIIKGMNQCGFIRK